MSPRTAGVWTAEELATALIRTAIGEARLEAALQLVIDDGPELFALLAARLLTVQPDVDDLGGGLWAEIEWAEVESAADAGAVWATPAQVVALRTAAATSGYVPGATAR